MDRASDPLAATGIAHPAALAADQLLAQCQVTRSRASGPGGQHRNKVETAITLLHRPTGVRGYASERRSQQENLRMALRRLRLALAVQVRSGLDLRTVPSSLWASRTQRQGRLALNPDHTDFPSLLAEALEVLEACRLDPARAALLLGCTSSQLIKMLKAHPPAWVHINQARAAQHLHCLH